jgi:plastocyanin
MRFRGPLRHDPPDSQPTAVTNGLVPIGSRLALLVLAGLLALALGACGSGQAAEAPQATADNNGGPTVTIKDLAFAPATLTVPAGATVTWVWQDGAIAHDVKGDGFKSKVQSEGDLPPPLRPARHVQVPLHPAPEHDRCDRGDGLMLKPTPTPARDAA